MKKVEAIIRPEKLDSVREELEKIGCPGMTITETKGHGQQKGIKLEWRVGTYRVDLLRKVKIEVVVKEESKNKVIEAILNTASTGEVGDGKIFVSPVEEVYRIRTREVGAIAI